MGVVYMFIGRERELGSLNNLYNSGKFELKTQFS
jgi:AAA+ ATPase superfamily predicted ATPase